MGELSTKSIIGLWTEEPDPADPTQVVRPPAGTTVNVWGDMGAARIMTRIAPD